VKLYGIIPAYFNYTSLKDGEIIKQGKGSQGRVSSRNDSFLFQCAFDIPVCILQQRSRPIKIKKPHFRILLHKNSVFRTRDI